MVTSHCTRPYTPSPSGTVPLPLRIAYRPVINADRDGVHWTSTLKFVSRSPASASESICGVAAPRMMPPPLNPGSPQPKLSMKTRTVFGLSSAWTIGVKKKRRAAYQSARVIFIDFALFHLYLELLSADRGFIHQAAFRLREDRHAAAVGGI